jgi:hypothetical protein
LQRSVWPLIAELDNLWFVVIAMIRICPNPVPWNEAFERLLRYAKAHPCTPPLPPTPLILAGWVSSNDVEKMRRWEETVGWANANNCTEVVEAIPDEDFYFVDEPTTYTISPLGGPMYQPWDLGCKGRPSLEEIAQHFETLKSRWSEIIGPELARITCPLAFTGNKARRLLIRAEGSARPPWGDWSRLSSVEAERRTFTRFREAINNAIAPHAVDHVDFTTAAEPDSQEDAPRTARPLP